MGEDERAWMRGHARTVWGQGNGWKWVGRRAIVDERDAHTCVQGGNGLRRQARGA